MSKYNTERAQSLTFRTIDKSWRTGSPTLLYVCPSRATRLFRQWVIMFSHGNSLGVPSLMHAWMKSDVYGLHPVITLALPIFLQHTHTHLFGPSFMFLLEFQGYLVAYTSRCKMLSSPNTEQDNRTFLLYREEPYLYIFCDRTRKRCQMCDIDVVLSPSHKPISR